jgi:hypothetical protein
MAELKFVGGELFVHFTYEASIKREIFPVWVYACADKLESVQDEDRPGSMMLTRRMHNEMAAAPPEDGR